MCYLLTAYEMVYVKSRQSNQETLPYSTQMVSALGDTSHKNLLCLKPNGSLLRGYMESVLDRWVGKELCSISYQIDQSWSYKN